MIKKIIILISVMLLLGAAATLYTQTWDPMWNPFRLEPEKVIENAAVKMGELKTFRVDSDFEFKIENQEEFSLAGNVDISRDKADPQEIKSAVNFGITFAMEGAQFSLGGETKTLGKISYLKLSTIPAFPLMGIDISEIHNQWIEISPEVLENPQKEIMGRLGMPEMEEKYEQAAEEQQEAIKEKLEKLKQLIEGKKFYLIKEELPDETIKGVKTYHYLVGLDREKIKSLIPEFFQIYYESFQSGSLEGQSEALEALSKGIDEFFEKTGEFEAEFWIGKKDNYLYKIKGEKTINLTQFGAEWEKLSFGAETGKITIKLNIDFSSFDQPMAIEAPEEFKPLKEILTPVLEKQQEFMSQTYSQTRDARIKADLAQLRIIAELIFDEENKYNICSDRYTLGGSGKYDTHLNTIQADIKGLRGTISCYAGLKTYCVSSLLNSGKYFCIDSDGVAKETTASCRSYNIGCKGQTL